MTQVVTSLIRGYITLGEQAGLSILWLSSQWYPLITGEENGRKRIWRRRLPRRTFIQGQIGQELPPPLVVRFPQVLESQNKAVVYSIYDSKGKRTYVGTTNNPGRRASQHARAGKLTRGGEMVVESGRMSRKSAEKLEARKIQVHQRWTGRLPRHNKTSDGQYHLWDC